MSEETIVAIFNTAEHAAAAVADLRAAGVPDADITQHRQGSVGMTTSSSVSTTGEKPGFWASLFGGEPEHAHDLGVYDRSVAAGGTVVTVKAMDARLDNVMDILERHDPVDIDERAAGYAETSTAYTSSAALPGAARAVADDGVIQLSEESLAVGKRAVNRGTTRVRRYVVETPVSESVTLRDETVSVTRRPVTDGTAVPATAFSDKIVEMTETNEEVVVSKTARVVEEVAIKKDVSERVETVKDTLRRDEVEITKEPTVGTTSTTSPLTNKSNSKI